ncbi:ABC transporter permease [Pseudoduganella lutea]|uniref:Sugar ABC transporter permease n=1 Tax=Pseudoduganella lutea TaxID=321985 RepID=A0A4P6KUM0_9BURK|nr:ABC transporter permease subunit [Pseudoduganella lutea]QBE61788.1 sugar ABC transporter permease [Pseudoduganella lutea]
MTAPATPTTRPPAPYLRRLGRDLARNRVAYLMLLPVVAYFAIFHYVPMYGTLIAFKDFNPAAGIAGSEWVGLEWFSQFFNGLFVERLIVNTLLLNIYDVLFGFPAPIILALLLNELTSERFRRLVQTITYLPHFISVVVVAGMLLDFAARDGILTQMAVALGGTPDPLINDPSWFRTLFVGSEIWQSVGWGSIIYLATLSAINPSLYEAARIDGANRWQRMVHVTLPGLLPIVSTLLVLRLGQLMTVGFEKVILLYNPGTYETADVISTYVYRHGILDANYSYAAAVGLCNSAVALLLLAAANRLSRKLTGNSIW